MTQYKIYTHNIDSNVHVAARWINKRGWAEYLIDFDSVSADHTICILKMPLEMVNRIRTEMNYGHVAEDDPPKIIEADEPDPELVKHFAEHGYRDNRYTLEINGKEIPRYDNERFFTLPTSAMERFSVLMSAHGGYGATGNAECYRWVDGVKLERQWVIVID